MAIPPVVIHSIRSVRWQLIFLACILAPTGAIGQVDSSRSDSTHRISFPGSVSQVEVIRPRRSLDAVISGGAGYYDLDKSVSFLPTANLDFIAQTSVLNFTAGFHWGFAKQATKSILVGARFPFNDESSSLNPFFADASLSFIDNGADSNAFSTGLRVALGSRLNSASLEYRVAAELRRIPFGGEHLEAWGGVELGFFMHVLREEAHELSRKDTLRATLHYIATADEVKRLEEARTDEELDAWLATFWKARETIANGSPTAAHDEYMRRVNAVNKEFGTPRKMGVETDEGRVILLYGEPDRRESAASTYDPTRRYLLWIYEDRIRGFKTAMFLFRTIVGNSSTGIFANHGDYRQVYSNVTGEYSEGQPNDLPAAMKNYVGSFGR